MHKGYVPGRWGQVHYREAGAGPMLACLHATAYSSRSLVPLMQALAGHRRVLALDTPGYGQSDGPPAQVPLGDYAAELAEAIAQRADGPADLFGYHTGALLAAEIAAVRPELVRRLVLIGIPVFTPAEKPSWRDKLVRPTALGPSLAQFQDRWDYLVTHRPDGLSLPRAFDNFVDELHAYPREWWAHAALFEHDPAPQLARIACPALVINPAGPLADASRRAAALLPDARVIEMPDLHGAVFEKAAGRLAAAMAAFLD